MSKRTRRFGVRSVRVRILASMLIVAAAGLAIAGTAAYLVQRERVQSQVDEQLAGDVENLRAIAEGPPGGTAPALVTDLLRTAIQRIVPSRSESTLALVNGEPTYVPAANLAFRIDDDPDLVARILRESDPIAVVQGTAQSGDRLLRYVIVPVEVDGDETAGLYVAAVDLGMEFERLGESFLAYAIIAGLALVVLALVGWFVAGRLLRPIRQLQITATHASEHDLSERVAVDGTDDISELARTVNGMLDRLQRAFESQRRLLDDVGHELRTPITIVRGHLELMDAAVPDEVRTTRDLTVDELDRMSMLVDDVALLARAGQPDFVTLTPVSVIDLTESVALKAAGLSSEHRWAGAGTDDGTRIPDWIIEADPRRLTEAWLQLAENAVKYSPIGSTITLDCVAREGAVELRVTDEGVGIPQEQRERMFGRFARAQQGRGIAGSGLGLSIVSAIADAHGGSARLEQASGGGTLAIIRIPGHEVPGPHTAPIPVQPSFGEVLHGAHPGR